MQLSIFTAWGSPHFWCALSQGFSIKTIMDIRSKWATVTLVTLVGSNGLEPSTSRLSGVCSNQLSYEPIYWWRISESNRWPPACKAGALASWANPPFFVCLAALLYYILYFKTTLLHNKCSAIRSTLTIKTWKKERISTVLDRLGFCLQISNP